MRRIFIIKVVLLAFLMAFTTQNNTINAFVRWSEKCLEFLREYSSGLPANFDDQLINRLSRSDRYLLKSNFELIGNPNPEGLVEQYVIDHPKKSTGDKLGFVEKLVLLRDSKLCIIGDIHGSIHALIRILWRLILKGYLDVYLNIIDPDFYMAFTGDYTDRGRYGVEVIITLLMLANQNKGKVFLLRGNHEDKTMNENYGLGVELIAKYGELGPSILDLIVDWYAHLPLALFIGRNGVFAQCSHGGIEPTFKAQEFLQTRSVFYDLEDNVGKGFLWSDFGFLKTPDGLFKLYSYEARGAVETKSARVSVQRYLSENPALKVFFRGHQHYNYGLKMFPAIAASPMKGPVHWKTIIPDASIIVLSRNSPVYTFSTGAEGAVIPYDCYGIVHIGEAWRDWTLTPYEYFLNETRDGKYVSLKIHEARSVGSSDVLNLSADAWQYVSTSQPICPKIIDRCGGAGVRRDLPGVDYETGSTKEVGAEAVRQSTSFGVKGRGRRLLAPLKGYTSGKKAKPWSNTERRMPGREVLIPIE